MERSVLPYKIKKLLDEFTSGLKDIYGDKLISVILYGSAASGEYAGKHSNVNIAVVLNDTSIPSLKKVQALINKRKYININPVFFTEKYVNNSTDVFPIEFLDMKENHLLLYGKDILSGINIDIKNLRFQCEQELKSKVLNIKKLYLRTRNRALLEGYLFKFFTSSMHILRNLVRLKGKQPSYKKSDLLDEISWAFSADVSCLRKIMEAKNKNVRLKSKDIDELFACLVEVLENISDKVDRL